MDRVLIPTEVCLPVSDELQAFFNSLSEKLASFLNSSMEHDPRSFRIDIDCEALDKYERPIFNVRLIELPIVECFGDKFIGMTTLLVDENSKLKDFFSSPCFESMKLNFLEKIKRSARYVV